MAKSIAITGSGIICSIGTDKGSVLNSLRNKKTGIGPILYLDSVQSLPVGEVKMSNDELKSLLGIASTRDISRTSLLGAIALKEAMLEANIDAQYLKDKRVALISGTTVGGMDVTERHYSKMLENADNINNRKVESSSNKSSINIDNEASYVLQHDCGSNSKEIAKLCGLECEVITISTACSSALNAIILGSRMLLANEADIILAGGSEALSKFHLNGFNSLLILDHEQCRPFDSSRRGLNLGEGAAYVVLERNDDRKKRQIKALGYIGGYGNRCDAFHQTATSENGEGAYLAMTDAISMSGLDPKDIDYINAHGTGTPDNDKSESAAVRRVFGKKIPPISSTKSYTGHTTSASGSIETVISLLAMHDSFIPANLGWEESAEECISPSKGEDNKSLHNILCNSFGFGGNDSAIIITDHPVPFIYNEIEDTVVVSTSEVNNTEDLKDLRTYFPPMETRRMSTILKASLLTSIRALEAAGLDKPDAIIIATEYGMLDQGEKILDHLVQNGEEGISPTMFMQSTHNTIAGALAIRFNCHGYNITYSQGKDSLECAIRDAKKLISEHKANNVLVGIHDCCPQKFCNFFNALGEPQPNELISKSMILKQVE